MSVYNGTRDLGGDAIALRATPDEGVRGYIFRS
jgi:hypothetical protein